MKILAVLSLIGVTWYSACNQRSEYESVDTLTDAVNCRKPFALEIEPGQYLGRSGIYLQDRTGNMLMIPLDRRFQLKNSEDLNEGMRAIVKEHDDKDMQKIKVYGRYSKDKNRIVADFVEVEGKEYDLSR